MKSSIFCKINYLSSYKLFLSRIERFFSFPVQWRPDIWFKMPISWKISCLYQKKESTIWLHTFFPHKNTCQFFAFSSKNELRNVSGRAFFLNENSLYWKYNSDKSAVLKVSIISIVDFSTKLRFSVSRNLYFCYLHCFTPEPF